MELWIRSQDKSSLVKVDNLYQLRQNKNLQSRIDKAIEYIEMFDIEHLHEICEHNLVDTLEALLDILKESGE